MSLFASIVLGLLEGLTEFLPVSSTGHLLIASNLLHLTGDFAAMIQVVIQLGAILAVAVLYRERFAHLVQFKHSEGFSGLRGLSLLALTTLPAVVIGALGAGTITGTLFRPMVVMVGLVVGALAILLVEARSPGVRYANLDALNWQTALAIGLFQCLALWPGISRSAATILGAMLVGVERRTATEYSFMAGVPVVAAAALHALVRNLSLLDASNLVPLAFGCLTAFASAWFAVRFFVAMLSAHSLRPFAWYRLMLAIGMTWFLWG